MFVVERPDGVLHVQRVVKLTGFDQVLLCPFVQFVFIRHSYAVQAIRPVTFTEVPENGPPFNGFHDPPGNRHSME